MGILRWGGALLLAGFLIFMGVQKFGETSPVFQFIAEQSGLAFFEPTVRTLVGVSELVAAITILAGLFVGKIRGFGPLMSTGIIGGALLFHLSPWLGINAPMGFDETGAYVFSPVLFYMAVPAFLLSIFLLFTECEHLMRMFGEKISSTSDG